MSRSLEILQNELRDRLDWIIKLIEGKDHDWQCGCGHWNGPNLAVCAVCGKKP